MVQEHCQKCCIRVY